MLLAALVPASATVSVHADDLLQLPRAWSAVFLMSTLPVCCNGPDT